jgi:hypothetical protein
VIAPAAPSEEIGFLKKENEELRQLNRLLALKVEKLERQLWSPKSERYVPDDTGQQKLFAEPKVEPAPAMPEASNPSRRTQASRIPKGPKPLDPSLPRQIPIFPSRTIRSVSLRWWGAKFCCEARRKADSRGL